MEPPWAMYPEIPAGSIGWRMGDGEEYARSWRKFVASLGTPERFLASLRRDPKAPWPWRGFLLPYILEELGCEDPRAWIDANDVLGVDVAYPTWVRNCQRKESFPAPWDGSFREQRLEALVIYHLRGFTFCCRWMNELRKAGRLASWLAASTEAKGDWTWVEAAIRGIAPSEKEHASPWERLGADMLMGGEPSAPWERQIEAPNREFRFNEDADVSDAFNQWVRTAFDDVPSLQAYVARHAGMTSSWAAIVERWSRKLSVA